MSFAHQYADPRRSDSRPTNVALVLIAVVLGGLRIAGVTHEAFQAVAHMFVAGLFTAWWMQFSTAEFPNDSWVKFVLGTVLSLLELTVAIWQRMAQ